MPETASDSSADQAPATCRPWGWFRTVCQAPGYLVKRIHVHAGQQLSLQRHRHRAEHWVVVRGTAQVTVGAAPSAEGGAELQVRDLSVGQHVDIPQGAVHRLGNRGPDPLEIVEVQFGIVLDEDDIERLQDDYGRA